MKRPISRCGPKAIVRIAVAAILVATLTANLIAQSPEVATAIARDSVPSRTVRLEPLGDRTTPVVVTAAAADPRGQWIAVSGDDHVIRIIEVATLKLEYTLSGHRDVIRTLAFDSSGNTLVSAGNDGQLMVWDRLRSFEMIQRIEGTPAIACVRFAPHATELAAVGFDPAVHILGRAVEQPPKFCCDCNDLRAVAYRDDRRVIAVGGRSGDLHLFDPETGRLIIDSPLHEGRIRDLAFHRAVNSLITVGEDGRVVVFDTETHQVLHRLTVTSGRLFAVAVVDSQHVAVAGSDNAIHIVNTDNGTVGEALSGHVGSISTLAIAGGMLFSGGYDATLRRWSISDLHGSERRIAEEGDTRLDR